MELQETGKSGDVMQQVYKLLEDFYAEHNPYLEKLRLNSVCSSDCTTCCNPMLRLSVLEAAHMLELHDVDNETIETRETLFTNKSFKEWFDLRIPCAFLINNVCSVYPNRPWICRSHFVAAHSTDCTQMVLPIKHITPAYFQMLAEAAKIIPLPYGAIPLYTALKWAKVYKRDGLDALYREVRKQ